ncbi:MAG: DNA gyrase inhibitor YacG [Proteobacteria bacterium]|nr:DNA gyrase inhibitor YacG [Cystobacterineae bacterium]MCL2259381.1 DNA gyrase inhibitor YacG [Cystobacterineae bacterium]MCL2314166.1 DNA gyrase inhibitor YacG [Pseudomonadota bacterium]
MNSRVFFCVQCGKAVASTPLESPFCGPRCKAIDLYRWLGEDYRIEETHFESVPTEEGILEGVEWKG